MTVRGVTTNVVRGVLEVMLLPGGFFNALSTQSVKNSERRTGVAKRQEVRQATGQKATTAAAIGLKRKQTNLCLIMMTRHVHRLL